jgi:fibronectin type 3 domain-containing protein
MVLSFSSMLFLTSCGKKLNTPEKIIIDSSLPKVETIRYIKDIDAVAFEWQPSYAQEVAGYKIFRSTIKGDNLKQIALIDDKYVSHYLDKNLKPSQTYYYKFVSFSSSGAQSVSSKTITVHTDPTIEELPLVKAIVGLPHRIKLVFRPHPKKNVSSYIIQKKTPSQTSWDTIATLEGRLNAEYMDKDLGNGKVYEYRIIAQTFSGVKSPPSKPIIAKTKSLPKTIKNIKATISLPKQIKLSWDKANEDDFDYYKIYKSESSLFFTQISTTKEPYFTHNINEDGRKLYYKITSIDKDGLESLKQNKAASGSTLTKPKAPTIFKPKIDQNNVITLSFQPNDSRVVKYEIVKTTQEDWSNKQTSYQTRSKTFIDDKVTKGTTYSYNVVGIDQYGIKSLPSSLVSVTTK